MVFDELSYLQSVEPEVHKEHHSFILDRYRSITCLSGVWWDWATQELQDE